MNQDQQNTTPQCREHQKGKGHGKHMIFMILGCLLMPIIVLIVIPKLSVSANLSWLGLLCPVMMVVMMIPMMYKHKDNNKAD